MCRIFISQVIRRIVDMVDIQATDSNLGQDPGTKVVTLGDRVGQGSIRRLLVRSMLHLVSPNTRQGKLYELTDFL